MKKIVFITQRQDKIGKFGENRDNIDVRFFKLFVALKLKPVLVPNNLFILNSLLKILKPTYIILSPGGDPRKKNVRKVIESKLISYSIRNSIPLLGICRGAQTLNIFFGGRLIRIKNHVRKNHEIFGKIVNKNNSVKVNSYHDFGIKKKNLGKGLVCMSQAKDGSVECFKHKKNKILGIMWHPERNKKIKNFDKKILKKYFICN